MPSQNIAFFGLFKPACSDMIQALISKMTVTLCAGMFQVLKRGFL